MNQIKKNAIFVLGSLLFSLAITTLANAQYYTYEQPDESLLAGIGIAMCIVVIIIYVVFILIGIWVYKDAKKRGSSGALWLVIVLLTGIIGIIIWLVIRPPIGGEPKQQQGTGRMCPNCGRSISMDAQLCPYCGKDFRIK
jgi:membrane protease YdiL (CAAX protease family)